MKQISYLEDFFFFWANKYSTILYFNSKKNPILHHNFSKFKRNRGSTFRGLNQPNFLLTQKGDNR